MDIETLRDLGGIVPSTPVEREVTWQPLNEDGSNRGEPVTFTVRIKKLSAGLSEALWTRDQALEKSGVVDHSTQAELLARTLYVGDRLITYDEAFNLDTKLATEFAKVVNAVNGWTPSDSAKSSPPPTNSGATSS